MPCIVCHLPTAHNSIYCPRHRKFGRLAADNQSLLAIRDAMVEGWRKDLDGFVCRYSGVLLDELTPKSPWYVSFDHIVPGQPRLATTAYLFNWMKNALTGDEFTTVVPELGDHFENGKPFNKSIIPFACWNHSIKFHTLLPRRVAPWEFPSRGVLDCVVCHGPLFPRSMYCARCRRFITTERDDAARRIAMIIAWCKEQNGFLCRYTGVKVDELDFRSPWYLNFDHITPGRKDLVVAASWVNRMKSCLTEPEFRAVIKSLAGHIRNGTPFDTGVVSSHRFALTARRLAPRNR